ncbi:MAG: serine--tRNA ligase [Xanthobacteraceae bacterium]|nr:serine--tRNA ligase [Xanthobacteraceae bacterium]MBX3547815.1 serine--tRNA ligase [Xanthobacteraceae bacterium]MCW5677107.1 serine--tRNA ligase [Xanthobacteraceae bacterium]
MHDIKWIRENPEAFDKALARRGLSAESRDLLALDEKRRAVIAKLQTMQERRNAVSKEVGEAKKAKDEPRAQKLMVEVASIKDEMPKLEAEQQAAEKKLDEILAAIPNLPAADVPDGKDETGNKEYRRHGNVPNLAFKPKLHFEIGEALGLMDFEAASKISGSRFVVLKGALARLERALAQLFLDTHTGEHGYTEVNPPVLVRNEAMYGTAQLPKFKEDQFQASSVDDVKVFQENRIPELPVVPTAEQLKATLDAIMLALQNRNPYWLIPTAEVPLTNLVREDITDEAKLPMRLTACTPCFRAEAGAAGKDTRGMIRQHQFTKVELVSITTPEQSAEEHERMLASAEKVLQKLGLHYRVMTLCTGDMGFASQKTYDIEVWLPGENTYREISSCSNCGEFQARRMNARYRAKDAKSPRYVHTLNGSGVAVGRALIAVLENYQNEDGSVTIPEALKTYMGGLTKITKAN